MTDEYKVAYYIRVSREEQAKGYSPDGQKSTLDSWLKETEWKWMKTYRIWEANRKIFCYPENWIEPELRDNKSEFFKELGKLGYKDISPSEALSLFIHNVKIRYIKKLHASG